jgi:hypothetical protein
MVFYPIPKILFLENKAHKKGFLYVEFFARTCMVIVLQVEGYNATAGHPVYNYLFHPVLKCNYKDTT